MIVSVSIALMVYAYLTIRLTKSWQVLESSYIQSELENVSIIVALRNEGCHVESLIQNFAELNYPPEQLEIILVDDHSDDNTYEDLNRLKGKLKCKMSVYALDDSKFGKKAAIRLGVENANHETLLFTHADCKLPSNWVQAMTSSKDLTVGPVKYEQKPGFFNELIRLDLINLVAIGGGLVQQGTPLLANGANLRIKRAVYQSITDGDIKLNIASGDDVFLIQAASVQQRTIDFKANVDAVVTTELPKSFKDLFQQRVRWAKKMKYTTMTKNISLMALLLAYLILLVLMIRIVLQFNVQLFQLYFVAYTIKYVLDLRYFKAILPVFKEQQLLRQLWWIEILHPLYVVGFAIISLFAPVKWKNRLYRHG